MEKIDLELGINPLAWAILALLEGRKLTFLPKDDTFRVYTRAWYNGREKGVSITMHTENTMCLAITFGENLNGIFVDAWELSGYPYAEPLTLNNYTDEAYAARQYFDCGDIGRAADYIYDKLERFYKKNKKKDQKKARM